MIGATDVRVGERQAERVIFRRLELYFATLTVLGAFVLAIGNDGAVIPMIAIFFAIVGYVFVDLLKFFSLPPTAAYIAMALAAVFCIADFTDRESAGPRKLLAVAHLLVLVQAILMMQRKSKRIFEQLAIFCLLELIVAAVFNHAISFGFLLIPITIIAAAALGLLAAVSAIESVDSSGAFLGPNAETNHHSSAIRVTVGESTRSAATRANQYSKMSVAMFAPAIILVAAVFFYALPRTSEASRTSRLGDALVGFADHVQLEQIGQMLRNPAIALHVGLVDRSSGESYRVASGIYLRGRVLERYEAKRMDDRTTAQWNALEITPDVDLAPLPREFFPRRTSDSNFYDTLMVSVQRESIRSDSLFVTAPYHRLNRTPEIVHLKDRWTIRTRESGLRTQSQIEYSFGTNAFRKGVQSELIARATEDASGANRMMQYRNELLVFDPNSMPSIARIANDLTANVKGERRSDYEIAKSIEEHFSTSSDYQYSLNLQSNSVKNLDPIEQFVSIDRKGHCQYFASALAMMLRSQKIPARVVVGYHTDEYNEWANLYVARQLHAHAWVEALIDSDQLGDRSRVYGQPESAQYWLRLDPTPFSDQGPEGPSPIRQSIDFAQDWWDDNVIEMDASQQQGSGITGGIHPSGQWHAIAVDWLSRQIHRIQAGDLGGGAFAGREVTFWPTAFTGVGLILAIVVLLRLRLATWIWRVPNRKSNAHEIRPSIEYYAAALDELARVGIHRRPAETPTEFIGTAAATMQQPGVPSIQGPMERLTATFYRHRFGGDLEPDDRWRSDSVTADLAAIKTSVESTLRIRTELANQTAEESIE
jgi:hypothetical protein